MNLIQTIILSAIEGLTEFLPISSTGHLILTTHALGIEPTEFVKSFEIIIQLGAILAVILLYYKTLLNRKVWPQIIIAFIPSAAIGFALYGFIKNVLLESSLVVVIMLFLGGIAFIVIEYLHKDKKYNEGGIEKITHKNALLIGVFQALSVIPGTSRAGASILGALMLGINRKTAAEFSFILAVPTILGATVLDIYETKLSFTQNELIMLFVGFLGAFIFALVSIKWLIKYVQHHSFVVFGIYRIILAILFFLIFLT